LLQELLSLFDSLIPNEAESPNHGPKSSLKYILELSFNRLYTLRSLSENMKHYLSTLNSPLFFQGIELNPPQNMSFLVLNKTNRGPFSSQREWNTEGEIPSRVPLNSNLA
jgi:hypothetical protein